MKTLKHVIKTEKKMFLKDLYNSLMKNHNFKVRGLANFPVGTTGHIEGRGNFENLPILLVFTVSD